MSTTVAQHVPAVLRSYPALGAAAAYTWSAAAGGFSGAQVFRVKADAGEFCLRAWPMETLPEARVRGLHRLLAHIHRCGVTQVAVPLASIDRSTLIRCASRWWHLESWMPGSADFHRSPTRERLRSIMQCLAQWHFAARSFTPRGDDEHAWFSCHSNVPSPAVVERHAEIRRWLSGDLNRLVKLVNDGPVSEFQHLGLRVLNDFKTAAPRVMHELEAVRALSFDLQPCLRDVWHDHVLLTGDSVTGLIDASACRSENIAADIARVLGSLIADDRACWRIALDEYAACRPLNVEETRLVAALDRSGVLLAGMTWLSRQYIERQNVEADPRVNQRLQGIATRLEALAGSL